MQGNSRKVIFRGFTDIKNFHDYNPSYTEALFLLGKDRRILILAPDISKNKAPASVNKTVSVCLNLSQWPFPVCAEELHLA